MKYLALSQPRRFYVVLQNMAILLCVLSVLSACSTLPKRLATPAKFAYDIETNDTSLGQLIQALKIKNPELTGYHILYDPLDALAARIHLIDRAEKTLDLQYYIWDNDKIGSLVLYKIIQAADRGVKIRLLIDDNNAHAMEGVYLALSQHANIEVKLFNPYRFRTLRAIDMVLDLKRINRRMHNKTFTADHQVSLIGGRNMSNQYYNISDNYQFSDLDVMLVGDAVDDINHSFDEYWNHEYAYPVIQVVNPKYNALRFDSLKQQLTTHYQKVTVQNYLDLSNRSNDFEKWLNQNIDLNWVKAEVVKDAPDKIKARAKKEEHLNFQLIQNLQTPVQHVDLVSAYFVPEQRGADKLSELAQNGVKVRVLTNSFRANDVAVVHAFYAKYRQQLLENGVELYEFLPALPDEAIDGTIEELSRKTRVSLKGLSRSSLHAKLMVLDNKQVFIGSFNFDPRSSNLNTEIGVILNSEHLATLVHQVMDNNLKRYAYQLRLNPDNKIQWLRQLPDKTIIYNKEPKMKWWKKIGLKLVSWLPLEGFM
ncbi:phospholipase [Acinetobacter larvae]|uniref:Phospholipase n=2 Tax=Acinetobacter larvae TaxID=1789224 RepID=A0A1B2M4B8_9GAMM|nr:phospholipase [Acinetobacter larvae]